MCPLCGSDHLHAQACAGEPDGSRVGQVIADKYRVLRKIAEGGMGAVYEACHTDIERPFALKFIHNWLASDAEWLRRFRREASAAGRIVNDHIAPVLDFGTAPDGSPYIVMELLRGETLSSRLQRQCPLDVTEAVELVQQACVGMVAAHAAGIVHRDLKPDNLFCCKRDAGGLDLKILDFGIAKLVDTQHSNETMTGRVMGTPGYMSPEQARGDSTIDEQTDVYSLGVILYELLCGQEPFRGESYNAVLHQVLTADVLPVEHVRPEVPARLARIVRQAMARDTARRFESVASFSAALSEFSGGPSAAETIGSLAHVSAAPRPSADAQAPSRSTLSEEGAPVDRIPLTSPDYRWLAAWALLGLAVALMVVRPWDSAPPATADSDSLAVGSAPPEVASGAAPSAATAPAATAPAATAPAATAPVVGDARSADAGADASEHSLASSLEASHAPMDAAPPTDAEPSVPNLVAPATTDAHLPPVAPRAPQPAPSSELEAVVLEEAQHESGKLTVHSTANAKLLVDGQPRGNVPIEGLSLSAGQHRLVVIHPQGGRLRRLAVIRPGELTLVAFEWTDESALPASGAQSAAFATRCEPPWVLSPEGVRVINRKCLDNPYR